jgi:hypothetical protein
MDEVTRRFKNHYEHCFDTHGAIAKGGDWRGTETANMRYENMLKVRVDKSSKASILDVGFGFAWLLSYLNDRKLNPDYTGIDVAQNMLKHSRKAFPSNQFIEADILSHQFTDTNDYIVCNGIFTQKINVRQPSMKHCVKKMNNTKFQLCNVGIVSNVNMDGIFSKTITALIKFSLDKIIRHIKIDHAYPWHEYTAYLCEEGL